MKRLLPSPALSLGLFLLWVLLMQSLSAGTVMLGMVLALSGPLVSARFTGTSLRVRKPLVALVLLCRVISDMLRSNAQVAALILSRRSRQGPSGFVRIPLDLRDHYGLLALAMIVTFVPGTAWAQLSADSRTLLLHVLVPHDESGIVSLIKRRYEAPLREIFE
jgi:multicomponent K+:H+ antiporter subunit E